MRASTRSRNRRGVGLPLDLPVERAVPDSFPVLPDDLKIDIAHVVRTFCFTGVDAGACLARAHWSRGPTPCGLPARLILLTDTDASSLSVQFVLTVPGAKRFPSLLLTECRLPRDRRSVHTRSHE